jgi:DNA processing protein
MTSAIDGACRECMRRSWLLSELSKLLNYSSRNESKLLELLGMGDEDLIQSIAGRRREELREHWERFELDELEVAPNVETVCKHSPSYPRSLRECKGAPTMLHVIGGRERLSKMLGEPAVAIVGSQQPTDYGMEMASSLARGLAKNGVTVLSGLANGIAAAAHAGALEVDGPTVTVMAGGVDVIKPASRRGLYERVTARGCAVAELPCGFQRRRWSEPARARTVAGLAWLTLVVEADDSKRELTSAHAAQTMERSVAAVPGRVTSPVSGGTNRLLKEGARMVRGPGDALDLLYEQIWPHKHRPPSPEPANLEPRLQTVLEQVGAGKDTPGKLTSTGHDPDETMLALTELELMGLLARGDGGRYVPRESLAGR